MPTLSGSVVIGGQSGASITAWKASRFTAPPIYDNPNPPSAPDGLPADAGPVVAGEGFGGAGEWAVAVPTNELYWVAASYGGHTAWQLNDSSIGQAGAQGPPGGDGAPGSPGSPGPPPTFRGDYDGATAYVTGDAVASGGSSYVATSAAPAGTAPPAAPWAVLAAKGTDGAPGAPGAAGATGAAGAPGVVQSVNAGTGIGVDSTDAAHPVVSSTLTGVPAAGTDGQFLGHAAGAPAWVAAPSGGGMTNPMTADGDVIRGGTAGAPTRVAKGTDGQVLTMVTGEPSWAAAAGGGGGMTNPMTTDGDLIRGGAAGAAARVPVGTAGQVLTVVSGEPAWAAAPAGGGGGGGGAAALLAATSYDPSTAITVTHSTLALADIDATNLAVTFTVPPSGVVLLRLTAFATGSPGSSVTRWGVRDTSPAVVAASVANMTVSANATRVSHAARISGLTAGATLTWVWQGGASFDGATGCTTLYGGTSGTTPTGAATMEVWDATVGDTAWTDATLANSWVVYGTPYANPGYRKDALGFVHLRGLAKSGDLAAALFTLPVGYRPSAQMLFGIPRHVGDVLIAATGEVTLGGETTNDYISLDGLTFFAEN